MLNFSDAAFNLLSIHHVGNKQQDTSGLILSEHPLELKDDILPQLLKQYFLTPFQNVNEVYRLYHPSDELTLNEVYHFTNQFFKNPENTDFHILSKQLSKQLYEASSHPKIKAGEVYIVNLKDIIMEGETCNAIGIFKSENKEPYLRVYPTTDGFELDYEAEAININKLDKGCLILDLESEQGYKVLVIDQTNRQQEAAYWKDDFLQLKIRNDTFQQTSNFLQVYKQFVTNEMDDSFEIERADKIDLLNKSMDYFKENETFVRTDFEEKVLGDPTAISLFKDYSQQFEADSDQFFNDEFEIAGKAVKRMQATYKSVLKLDKNFHVYIHGKREYLEKGFDEEKGLNFYKLYFEHEL